MWKPSSRGPLATAWPPHRPAPQARVTQTGSFQVWGRSRAAVHLCLLLPRGHGRHLCPGPSVYLSTPDSEDEDGPHSGPWTPSGDTETKPSPPRSLCPRARGVGPLLRLGREVAGGAPRCAHPTVSVCTAHQGRPTAWPGASWRLVVTGPPGLPGSPPPTAHGPALRPRAGKTPAPRGITCITCIIFQGSGRSLSFQPDAVRRGQVRGSGATEMGFSSIGTWVCGPCRLRGMAGSGRGCPGGSPPGTPPLGCSHLHL